MDVLSTPFARFYLDDLRSLNKAIRTHFYNSVKCWMD